MQMPWGNHRGEEIENIPSDYLKWLARDCNDEDIAMAADTEYQYREKYNVHIF